MEEYQRYRIKGLKENDDGEKLIDHLTRAGYYQCEVNVNSNELYIPLSFADYIDDIEELLLEIGYEFEE